MKIKPLFDRVLIQPQELVHTTSAGIVLPNTSMDRPQTGVIVAAGEGAMTDGKRQPMSVQVGDTVLYAKYMGTEIRLQECDYILMQEIDILGVMEEK